MESGDTQSLHDSRRSLQHMLHISHRATVKPLHGCLRPETQERLTRRPIHRRLRMPARACASEYVCRRTVMRNQRLRAPHYPKLYILISGNEEEKREKQADQRDRVGTSLPTPKANNSSNDAYLFRPRRCKT